MRHPAKVGHPPDYHQNSVFDGDWYSGFHFLSRKGYQKAIDFADYNCAMTPSVPARRSGLIKISG